MNAAELARRLLIYTDLRTLSEASTAGSEYLVGAVDAINAAAQELYSLAPDFLCVRPYGLTIRAPATITLAGLAIGSSATGTITGYASWMLGCTVRISGEPDTRLLAYAAGVGTLSHQITTTTGTASATVYADCVSLPDEVTVVLAGVCLADKRALAQASGSNGLAWSASRYEDFGLGAVSHTRGAIGQPRTYFVTASSLADNLALPTLQIILSPMPDTVELLTFRARLRPASISVDDLDAANNGAAATKEIPLPAGWDELFLLPFALQRFTGSAFFNNAAVKEEIARQYVVARDSIWKLHPQGGRTVRFIPSY